MLGLLSPAAKDRWVLVLSLMTLTPAAALAAPLAAVMFEDSPSLDPAELLPAYQAALGRPLGEGVTQLVADGLIGRYQQLGYLPPAPRAVRVHAGAGALMMEMREARVVRVQVSGSERVESSELERRVRALKAIRPLSRAAFDDWLAAANTRGVAVQGALFRSSGQPHEYVASLSVDDRRWQGLAHIDNRGPTQLGREIAQLSLSYRWPRESWGSLRVDGAAAVDHERLRYVGVSGGHRVLSRGDRLRWKYARSESTLPVPDTEREVDYDREKVELGYEVPLVRRTHRRTDVRVAFRSYDLDQFLDDGRRLRRDRIRALELGYDGVVATVGGRHGISVLLSRGIDGLGASLSPPGADADFTSLALDYSFRRALNDDWRVATALTGQISGDRLPSSERFFIGGRDLGGAFDPATLGGDQGLGARVTLERRLQPSFMAALTAFAYYDHGWVWSNDPARPADDAGSAGAGLRGQLGALSWSVEAAAPVRSPTTPTLLEDDPKVFFSLSQRF